MTLPKITRGPYEVTANLEYPTTERVDIPNEWIKGKCAKCRMTVFIDEQAKKIHHQQPFCTWWKYIWSDKTRMTIEVDKLVNIRIGKLIENVRQGRGRR
jgi:hypothetical protein